MSKTKRILHKVTTKHAKDIMKNYRAKTPDDFSPHDAIADALHFCLLYDVNPFSYLRRAIDFFTEEATGQTDESEYIPGDPCVSLSMKEMELFEYARIKLEELESAWDILNSPEEEKEVRPTLTLP